MNAHTKIHQIWISSEFEIALLKLHIRTRYIIHSTFQFDGQITVHYMDENLTFDDM